MNPLQIAKLRNDTLGCQQIIHFNNAGASLSPACVVNSIKNHLDLEARMGGYEAARLMDDKIESVYSSIARLINCDRKEIAFAENATRAWDLIFYSLKFNKGDRILTSVAEYASNYLAFLHRARKTGIIIDVINNDSSGQLDVIDLQNKVDNKVKLIAITHVPTQGGLVNPAAEVGKVAKLMNIPYLLDTTQSIGQMPIDVETIGCDFLCATGRKYLRGPRGTGFLYARATKLAYCDPPFIDLHAATWIEDNDFVIRADARCFETWEQNIAAKIGLGEAIEYALDIGLPTIWERIQYLANCLRQQLEKIPTIQLQDLGLTKCGIITFTSDNASPEEIQQKLFAKNINVSVSLEEYARLDLARRNLPALVRASVHYYNTEEEIASFIKALTRICK